MKKSSEKAKRIVATAAISLRWRGRCIRSRFGGSGHGNHFQKDRATAASLEQVGGTVTIESGETVYGVAQSIANKEHKDPRDVASDIAAVNPGVNTGEVEAGQPINIPAPELKDVAKASGTLPVAHPSHQAKQ